MNTLGQRPQACRKEKGYTQVEVCARVGIRQTTLSELENDVYPSSSFVPQLVALYGVEALWLATGRGPRHRNATDLNQMSETAVEIARVVNRHSPTYPAALLQLPLAEAVGEDASATGFIN